jgi:predicted nuclease of predicted toxin-antitoxin system
MKLLLDENFPQKVPVDFPEHSFTTVEKAGWKGKKNGELLGLMAKEGFDALITLDRNLPKQQNLSKYAVKIFVLQSLDSRPSSVQPLIGKLRSALNKLSSNQVTEIE